MKEQFYKDSVPIPDTNYKKNWGMLCGILWNRLWNKPPKFHVDNRSHAFFHSGNWHGYWNYFHPGYSHKGFKILNMKDVGRLSLILYFGDGEAVLVRHYKKENK